MGHKRDGYNSRARQSTRPAKRAKSEHDTNVEIISVITKEEKEFERKEKMKNMLLEQSDSKITSQKKKRLEKYIEKKLKKEDRILLFQKLATSQAGISDASGLQSSSMLGSGIRFNKPDFQDISDHLRESNSDFIDDGLNRKEHTNLNRTGLSYDNPVIVQNDDVVDSSTSADTRGNHAYASNSYDTYKGSTSRDAQQTNKGKIIKFPSWNITHSVTNETNKKNLLVNSESDGSLSDEGSDHDSKNSDNDGTIDSWNGMEEPETSQTMVQKRLGFKEWAVQQLNIAKGYTNNSNDQGLENFPSAEIFEEKRHGDTRGIVHGSKSVGAIPEKRGPLGDTFMLPNNVLTNAGIREETRDAIFKKMVVDVERSDEVQRSREALPIFAEEQPIIEAIRFNPVVIICGETGSGKTTQIPQFLYEAGFTSQDGEHTGMIGITQPRRVAAMSMASRVAYELSLPHSRVSYQIRYDATTSPSTSIKFMTDGILLRELSEDIMLSRYSVIIIDEAHERSLNTDILIGVVSRVIGLREVMYLEGKKGVKPLRLIIMSATMRVDDFVSNRSLFPSVPPIVHVSSRQHPVTVHFSRRTSSDYVSEAIKKASKIHCRLPSGGILIFLTGQNEIAGVCAALNRKFGKSAVELRRNKRNEMKGLKGREGIADETVQLGLANFNLSQVETEVEDIDLIHSFTSREMTEDQSACVDSDPEALDSEEDRVEDELGIDAEESDTPMYILPLFSMLSSEQQMRVFDPPPQDSRLVVIATNVAETSLTIPGIRYVIDCGRVKERQYNATNGVQAFNISWISKASAAQRAGRAGRSGPGHCYRLYSSSLFEHHFDDYTKPEILRMPMESVVLQMKNMHIDNITNFPFPTPPNQGNLRKAEQLLTHLGAIHGKSSGKEESGSITEIGKSMALFPLSPRFAKLLINGRQHNCLPYVIILVSAISVGDPFVHEEFLKDADNIPENAKIDSPSTCSAEIQEETIIRRRLFFNSRESHRALGNGSSDTFQVLSVVGAYEYAGGGHQFCRDHFVRPKAMEEIHRLRSQISNIVLRNFPDVDVGKITDLRPPNDLQVLRQLLCSAFIDQVAVRKDIINKSARSIHATSKGIPYQALGVNEDVFIHPSSVYYDKTPPDFVIYQELVRTNKLWIKVLTIVNPAWLAALGRGSLCTFSKPKRAATGDMLVIPHFGPAGWELPAMNVTKLSL